MAVIMRALKPRKGVYPQAVLDVMKAEAKSIGHGIKADYARTYKTWSDKPEFKIFTLVKQDLIRVRVVTESAAYAGIDQGTPGRLVGEIAVAERTRRYRGAFRLRNADDVGQVLRWRKGWQPKTKPNVLDSFPGHKGDGDWVSKKLPAWQAGTQARNFTAMIEAKWKPESQRRFKNALARGMRAATK